jgi:SAM-dependent methyltransferase
VGPIDAVLAEAARLLKPGGRFILTVPGPGFHAALRTPPAGRAREAYLAQIDARCAHLRYWSLAEWEEHLGRCGLVVTTCTDYLTPAQTRRWQALSAVTGGLLYRLYGGKRQPIEIQRRLGLRQARPGLLGAIASGCAPLLAAGCRLDAMRASSGEGACLLIDAVKR